MCWNYVAKLRLCGVATAAFLFSAITMASAWSDVVIHEFSGTVTKAVSVPGVEVGDTFQATLSYVVPQAPFYTTSVQARYSDYTFVLTVGGYVFDEDPASSIMVSNNESYGDNFSTQGTDTGFAGFGLTDSSGSAFESTDLPTSLTISGFSSNFVAVGGGNLLGSITSISTTIVTADLMIEELLVEVDNINLANGISNSLDKKLENALGAWDAESADQRLDATNKMEAFINSVEAQRGKAISDAEADYLINAANDIIVSLQS